MAKESMWIAVA